MRSPVAALAVALVATVACSAPSVYLLADAGHDTTVDVPADVPADVAADGIDAPAVDRQVIDAPSDAVDVLTDRAAVDVVDAGGDVVVVDDRAADVAGDAPPSDTAGGDVAADVGADVPTDVTPPSDVATCRTDLTRCGGTCVDTATDRANCGGCGLTCGPTGACSAGACHCTSGSNCGAGVGCVALNTNDHCGSCTQRCPASHRCELSSGRYQCNNITCAEGCPSGSACCPTESFCTALPSGWSFCNGCATRAECLSGGAPCGLTGEPCCPTAGCLYSLRCVGGRCEM